MQIDLTKYSEDELVSLDHYCKAASKNSVLDGEPAKITLFFTEISLAIFNEKQSRR